jgi:hypothetical protein
MRCVDLRGILNTFLVNYLGGAPSPPIRTRNANANGKKKTGKKAQTDSMGMATRSGHAGQVGSGASLTMGAAGLMARSDTESDSDLRPTRPVFLTNVYGSDRENRG